MRMLRMVNIDWCTLDSDPEATSSADIHEASKLGKQVMGSAITIVKEFLSAVSWMTSVATHRAPSPFARDMGELSRSTEKILRRVAEKSC